MKNTFPTKLSDLAPSDPLTTPNIYTTLKHLRKTTLSLHNRLHSILTDAAYISDKIQPTFSPLPLLANERCGSWYIPPRLKGGSAYFKSTDGHYGAWAFSLRRLNLQVLDLLGVYGGAVLVDSTRRGKRMPDALRRTVPVWVLVWNWVLFGDEFRERDGWEWAFRLQHPGLEDGEVRLIEKGLGGWMDGVRGLGLDLVGLRERLGSPVRLAWVVHGEDEMDVDVGLSDEQKSRCRLLVLCSASRRVLGAEMSEDGYVQGAADDAEGWSGGLTSAVFWQRKDELLAARDDELPDLITRLLEESKAVADHAQAIHVKPTKNVFVAVASQWDTDEDLKSFDVVVDCNGMATDENPCRVSLGCRRGKLGSRDLREKLPRAVDAVSAALEKNSNNKVLIICETGKDLSIGVAVALLCMLYDDEGRLEQSRSIVVDKQLVKKRLAWITSIKPDANPSRSTLQAVNSFLMS